MKKKILFIVLFSFFLPFNVFALPREGVYYFFTYPNGLEVVSENYEDTVDEKEILLYSGTSDSNGEVILPQFDNQGTLRIVEKVPNGYSIESKEITVDLSRQSSVEFVNTKGMINPKTGRSILLIIEVLFVVFGIVYFISHKKKAKILLLFLIVIGVILLSNVKAKQQDFTIIVRDKDGKRLSNVEVEVYSKAISIDASPAIKLNANGGSFLDGETSMYLRLPASECSYKGFREFLIENYLDSYLNVIFAQKEKYEFDGFDMDSDTYHHGDVLDIYWERISDEYLSQQLDFDFNGGILYFRGKEITELQNIMFSPMIFTYVTRVQNGNSIVVGMDENSNCNHFNSYGALKNRDYYRDLGIDNMPSKFYICWNDRPDGIYVNGNIFLGDINSCFAQSYMDVYGNQISFSTLDHNKSFRFTIDNGDVLIYPIEVFSPFFFRIDDSLTDPIGSTNFRFNSLNDTVINAPMLKNETEMINTLEIIEGGQTRLTITSSDLDYINEEGFYVVTNSSKKDILYDLYGILDDGCGR